VIVATRQSSLLELGASTRAALALERAFKILEVKGDTMKSTVQMLFKMIFRLVEILMPALAGRWATSLFLTPIKNKRPDYESEFIQDAIIQKIPIVESYDQSLTNPYYVKYSWGRGMPILLIHGWAGRGSQVAALAKPLVEAGYKVITFDALAHGDSPGKKTTLPEFVRVIQHIAAKEGKFRAMIGHSFGGVAMALAVNDGVEAEKLITIGSPASMAFIFEEFGKQINASHTSTKKIGTYIETLTQRHIDDFSLKNLVLTLTQPSLIIHDKNDKEVDYGQSLILANSWLGSKHILTENLGHRRILRDSNTISKIVEFITTHKIEVNGYNSEVEFKGQKLVAMSTDLSF
ncbi:MAG: alpha/beta hydrolase, partial [Chloroflexota bacterium]